MAIVTNPTTDERIESASNTLDKINFWIGNCDTKVSFSLAFAGILLGGFLSSGIISGSLKKLIDNLAKIESTKDYWDARLIEITTILLVAFIVCFAITVVFLFQALKGSIDTSVYHQTGLITDSKLFFGTIGNQTFTSFKDKVMVSNKNNILNDYLSQIYINSKICSRKFERYNKGIKWLVVSSILFVVLHVLFLFQ